jgi:hypothetical protein
MRNKVKSGVVFGLSMTFIFLCKDFIGWIKGEEFSNKEVLISIFSSLFGGLLSGLLYGWLTDKVLVNSIFTKPPKFNLHTGETIIFQTGANHFKHLEAVGGQLCLTDKRLIFKSHNLNIQNHELTIDLEDIKSIDTFKPLWLTNNGIVIKTDNPTVEKFVVEKREKWKKTLEEIKNGIQH